MANISSVNNEASRVLENSMNLRGPIKRSLEQQTEGADANILEDVSGFLAVLFELILATLVLRSEQRKLSPFMRELVQALKPILYGNGVPLVEEKEEVAQLLKCFLDTEGKA